MLPLTICKKLHQPNTFSPTINVNVRKIHRINIYLFIYLFWEFGAPPNWNLIWCISSKKHELSNQKWKFKETKWEITISFEANSALNLFARAGLEVDLAGLGDRRRRDERRRVRVIHHWIARERISCRENCRAIGLPSQTTNSWTKTLIPNSLSPFSLSLSLSPWLSLYEYVRICVGLRGNSTSMTLLMTRGNKRKSL